MSKPIEKVEGPYRVIERREFESGAEFDPKPSFLVLVAVLEFAVRDDYGDYLLVINPHYEEIEVPKKNRARKVEDGFWTVPYVTKTLPAASGGFRHLAATSSAVDKAVDEWNPKELLMASASTLSFGECEIKFVSAFCEFKHSWTQPNVMKLYHIMRYSLLLHSPAPRNIADGASRKGYSFLPIDERYRTVTKKRPKCPVHLHPETSYLSVPLATNLATVLNNDDHRREIRSRAMTLEREHFSRDFTGLLFCGDIAGYGAASSYAEDKIKDFTADNLGAVLRDSATIAFTDLFLEAGIDQVHTAGDGFICALPLDSVSEKRAAIEARAALKRFAAGYTSYLRRLDELSDRIITHYGSNHDGDLDGAPLLGSRLAIHYGGYRYGKISQAASLVTSFDGNEIVAVSRLEQGLRSITKDDTLATQYKINGTRHTAAASLQLVKLLRPDNVILPDLFQKGQTSEAASKEFEEAAWLLRSITAQPKPKRRPSSR